MGPRNDRTKGLLLSLTPPKACRPTIVSEWPTIRELRDFGQHFGELLPPICIGEVRAERPGMPLQVTDVVLA